MKKLWLLILGVTCLLGTSSLFAWGDIDIYDPNGFGTHSGRSIHIRAEVSWWSDIADEVAYLKAFLVHGSNPQLGARSDSDDDWWNELSLSTTGYLPLNLSTGYYTIRVWAYNYWGWQISYEDVNFYYQAENPNTPPTLWRIWHEGTSRVGHPFAIYYDVTDWDGDPLTFSWTIRRPNGTSFPSSQVIRLPGYDAYSFTPDMAGTWYMSLTVNDGRGGSDDDWLYEDVSPQNRPPSINMSLSPNRKEDEAIAINLNASDPDGDSLNQSVTVTGSNGQNGGLRYVGGYSWTFTPNAPGQWSIAATVRDPSGEQASASQTITIEQANLPPTVSLSASSERLVGSAITLTATASDPDNDLSASSYTMTVAGPGGAQGSLTRNNINTWTLIPNQGGTWTAQVTVEDSHGASANSQVSLAIPVPSIVISQPANNGVLSEQATIVATASHMPTNFAYLKAFLVVGDSGNPLLGDRSDADDDADNALSLRTQVGNGNIATSVASGTYLLKVWAYDSAGEPIASVEQDVVYNPYPLQIDWQWLGAVMPEATVRTPLGEFGASRNTNQDGFHFGTDFLTDPNDVTVLHNPFYAIQGGTIRAAVTNPNAVPSLGRYVTIASDVTRNGNTYRVEITYAHLEQVFVTTGTVTAGQLLGVTGTSGYTVNASTPPHIHVFYKVVDGGGNYSLPSQVETDFTENSEYKRSSNTGSYYLNPELFTSQNVVDSILRWFWQLFESETSTQPVRRSANTTIEAGQNYTVVANQSVALTAGEEISLDDGFVVEEGAIFEASINPSLNA